MHNRICTTRLYRIALLLGALGALLLFTLSAAPPTSAHVQTIPARALLNTDGTINTKTSASGALDLRGWHVTLDSQRGPLLTPQQEPNAPNATWSALPNGGLDGYVYAMAVSGRTLYVAGNFNATEDQAVTNMNFIAKFNSKTNKWSALPNGGLNNTVLVLAVSGKTLYVGGFFTKTADGKVKHLNHIAKFNSKTNKWSALSNGGLNNDVDALAVSGSTLYVGGDFTETADSNVTNLNKIAAFDTIGNSWSALPDNGLNSGVLVLSVSGSTLYVGGRFTQTADGTVTNLGFIAALNTIGNSWLALPHNGLNSVVDALAVSGSTLYVGGDFTQTADSNMTNLNGIAALDTIGNSWSTLPDNGLNGHVLVLAVSGSTLYVGGGFTQTADGTVTNLNRIAAFDTIGNSWFTLPHKGLNNIVYGLAVSGSTLYVSGDFNWTADRKVKNLLHLARLH